MRMNPGDESHATPPTILVVDDDASLRDLVAEMLARGGYRALVAADGVQALALARAHAPAIRAVLLDLMMPTMTGEELLPLLREHLPETPVLVQSGLAQEESLRRLCALGIRGFLQKPFRSEQLLRVVRETLGDS